ncbi:MAG: AEC family transporter [Limnochordales bacterium]|nr:AEC family transporter [Limnochordales bacterium]
MNEAWTTAKEPLLLLVGLGGIGYLARRRGWLSRRSEEELTQLLYRLTVPALIFVNTVQRLDRSMLLDGLVVLLLSVFLAGAGLAVGLTVARLGRLPGLTQGAFAVASAFPNTLFLGLPVCVAVLGPEAVPLVVLYDFGTSLVFWTVGIQVLQGRGLPGFVLPRVSAAAPQIAPAKGAGEGGTGERMVAGWRRLLLNPNLAALLAGALLVLAGARLPSSLLVPLEKLGQVTVPVALLLIGSLFAGLNGGGGSWFPVLGIVSLRMLALPALAFLLGILFLPAGSLAARVVLVEAAMPTMTMSALYAEALGGETSTAVRGVVATVLFSLVQLPFVGWLATLL